MLNVHSIYFGRSRYIAIYRKSMNFTGLRLILKCTTQPCALPALLSRNYAFKSDLKIKWIRPTKIASHTAPRSGDLNTLVVPNATELVQDFVNSKELENASETVRKLFSLEFAPRRKKIEIYKTNTIQSVNRHDLDYASVEAKIARWTAVIRSMQQVMEEFPRNRRLKSTLNIIIDKRKKHLKYLRRWDYKRFEWLLEQLDLEYKPVPLNLYTASRKDSLRKLTDEYCDTIKQDRLNAYKEELQSAQPAFLEEKIRTLEHVRALQEECGVPTTVTLQDIDKLREQLVQLNVARDAAQT